MGGSAEALTRKPDLLSIYSANCQLLPADQVPILIGSQKLEGSSELFYAPVLVSGKVTLRGMLDSGSMSCTLSEEAEKKLQAAGVLPSAQPIPGNVVIVGCGGKTTYPKCFYDLEVEVYESKFIVPTLVVPGQRDDFIIGTNQSPQDFAGLFCDSCGLKLLISRGLFQQVAVKVAVFFRCLLR